MDQEQHAVGERLVSIQAELATVFDAVPAQNLEAFLGVFADFDRRMFFSGQGRSGLIAQMAAMRFMHLGVESHFVGEATAPSVRNGDVLLLISGSGKKAVTVGYAQIAKREGATVAVITSDPSSELARLADFTLCLMTDHTRQFGGSLFEQSSLLALDGIVMSLVSQNGNATAEMADRHTNLQ